mgnify:CR=1 FL=1
MVNKFKTEKRRMKGARGMVQRMKLASILSQIKYLEDLIEIKSRVSRMMPIDYYIENADALITISGWEADK